MNFSWVFAPKSASLLLYPLRCQSIGYADYESCHIMDVKPSDLKRPGKELENFLKHEA